MKVELPLSGKTVVVTRAEDQSDLIVSELERLGGEVICVPTIKIVLSALSPEDVSRISTFGEYDAVVFTSANAVKNVRSHVAMQKDSSGKPFVVAVGRITAEALENAGIAPDLVPHKFNSGELVKSLGHFDWENKRVLIPKGNLSGSEIADFLKAKGGIVDEIIVYKTLPNNFVEPRLKSRISSRQFDSIVFFSPSQVKNFLNIFGASVLNGKQIAVIGPTTKKAAEANGLTVDIVPDESTTESLIASMVGNEKTL